jgi:hypothetical protein
MGIGDGGILIMELTENKHAPRSLLDMGGEGSTDPSDGVGKTRDADPCGSVPAVVAMRLEIMHTQVQWRT